MIGLARFLVYALALVPALLIAIPVHELGHATAAYFLGDRSIRYFGYFTWNPRRFIDPLGALAVFIALVGWGRRVPVQSNRIGTTGQKVVYELAGPGANLVVGIVLGLLLRALVAGGATANPVSFPGVLVVILYATWFLNLSIFAFQLLPIPGLDGWEIVEALFRNRNARFFFNVSMRRQQIWIGAIVLIFVFQILQGANLLGIVMSPFYTPASLISVGSCIGYAIPGLTGLHPCLPLGA